MHDPSQHSDERRAHNEVDPAFVAPGDQKRDRDDAAHASSEIGEPEPPANDVR
jgi:hypothetical protein